MIDKNGLYDLIKRVLDDKILTKKEVLDVFVDILRDSFSIEEMLGIMGNAESLFLKKKRKKKEEKKDVMSYPSVIGIPLNVVYEKIFKK